MGKASDLDPALDEPARRQAVDGNSTHNDRQTACGDAEQRLLKRTSKLEPADHPVIDRKEIVQSYRQIGNCPAIGFDVDTGATGTVMISDWLVTDVVIRHQLSQEV